ncbi:MAG: hypothetical protein DI626_04670 [Micavibrio aeruginosavorus]|uniref:Thioredoxin-like fold domain-containing protein n=1 Tax=Micavibrio aeruginosavorus TaxID=349221 RepID=A0A2W5A1L1_9BACT|nr:MAG: hypothetical protein DI626_04670 [Micavibrio aeruginosavorus]
MLFRIFICVMTVLCLYAVYSIVKIRNFYADIRNPAAEFTVKNPDSPRNHNPLTIVEFVNYDCGYCAATHLVLLDYTEDNPDVVYVARPVPYANGNAEQKAKVVLAAGLQGKFWDMDKVLTEYTGPVDEKFLSETAALYEMDLEKLKTDINGNDVFKFAQDNAHASQRLGLETTPAFMIGKMIYQPDAPLTLSDLIRMVHLEQNK